MAGRVGIMQPYFFPYLGYFQLIHAVDQFVFLDDVDYIKDGWINRNRILLNGTAHSVTVPLRKASSFKPINEIHLAIDAKWVRKFFKKIEQAYIKAPYFDNVIHLIKKVFDPMPERIDELAIRTCQASCDYLGVKKDFYTASRVDLNRSGKGQERVLFLCDRLSADTYINSYNGKRLYSEEAFEQKGIGLSFLHPHFPLYKQFGNAFVSGLSIIDVMMFNSPSAIREMLDQYSLE